MAMKQLEPKEVEVNGYVFYIFPFPALLASNILGKLNKALSPLAKGIAPLVGMAVQTKQEGETSPFDMDITAASPLISEALSSLDGDVLQGTLEVLLLKHGNVTWENPEKGEAVKLTKDDVNGLFCQELGGLFLLAYHVIKVNYGSFFTKTLSRFGSLGA